MSANGRKPRKPQTPAEIEARKAERAARVAALEAAAESFDLDDDDTVMVRAFADLCTHYSEGNAMLILAQAADLGLKITGLVDVGAFGTFRAADRMVRKGEHAAIWIWAPAGSDAQADKTEDAPASAGSDVKVRRFFKLTPLFHITQTDPITEEVTP